MGISPARSRDARSVALSLLLALGACGGPSGPASPREALDSVRAAALDGDAATLYTLLDRESQGFYAQLIREQRARLAAGHSVEQVFGPDGADFADAAKGTEQEAVVRFVEQSAPLLRRPELAKDGEISGEEQLGPREWRARIGKGKGALNVWFVREKDGWAYDHYRTVYVR